MVRRSGGLGGLRLTGAVAARSIFNRRCTQMHADGAWSAGLPRALAGETPICQPRICVHLRLKFYLVVAAAQLGPVAL